MDNALIGNIVLAGLMLLWKIAESRKNLSKEVFEVWARSIDERLKRLEK